MADEKGVALAVLGVVAVLAIVGLVLLFTGAKTGSSVYYPYAHTGSKFSEAAYAGTTDYAPIEQLNWDAVTGGPAYLRNRWSRGTEGDTERYYTEAGGESVGVYGEAKNTGGYPR